MWVGGVGCVGREGGVGGGLLWDARQAGHWPRYSKKSGRKDFKRYKTLIPQMFLLPKFSLRAADL